MRNSIFICIITLTLILFAGCSKKATTSDNFYYYDDMSKNNFELVQKGNPIDDSSNYLSIIRYKYEIKSKSYPIQKDYPLDIPFYLGEESKKILAIRSNAPFTYKDSVDKSFNVINVDYSKLEVNPESGNRDFVIELISDDAVTNKIDRSITISGLYSDDDEYMRYLDIEIDPKVKELADEIRSNLPEDEQDNLRKVAYEYTNWILANIHYPLNFYNYSDKYVNLDDSVRTLELGVGVCEDFTLLLSEMFASQGIISRKLDGYSIKGLSEENGTLLGDFNPHQVIEVYDGKDWISMEPTVYYFNNPIDFEIEGETIKVARGLKVDTVIVQAFMPKVLVKRGRASSSSTGRISGCELVDIDFMPLYK